MIGAIHCSMTVLLLLQRLLYIVHDVEFMLQPQYILAMLEAALLQNSVLKPKKSRRVTAFKQLTSGSAWLKSQSNGLSAFQLTIAVLEASGYQVC